MVCCKRKILMHSLSDCGPTEVGQRTVRISTEFAMSCIRFTIVCVNQWLNMWGRLCRGAAGISGFPIWVQLLAIVFFEVIDRDEDGLLEFEELSNYYKGIVGVKTEDLYVVTKEGYRVLTANEGYLLNQENYLFCFANFLLGRDIYGPGKYIFGVFDNREMKEKYQIIYNEEDE